jgi:gluconolactonase
MTGDPFEIHAPAFRDLALPVASLDRLWDGGRWTEGPVYLPLADCVIWSDIPNNRMLQWTEGAGTRVFRQPSNFANGNTRDREGRLVTCEHGTRRVTRTEHDGSITVLADRWEGKRLNSPNDVVVARDGAIWFTDPPYGILSDYEGHKAESEIGACHVYRIDPATGAVGKMIDDMARPNGLAFSPDERLLYVADTAWAHDPAAPRHIRVYPVLDGTRPGPGRVFVTMTEGCADGFRLDRAGNLWTSAGDGVHCLAPSGELLGKIRVPEVVSNLTFGGPRRNRLFITATRSLYAIYVATNGLS